MDTEGSQQGIKLKKGPWKPEEDLLLTRYVETHGEGKWTTVSKRSGLMREGKSCRLRWKNYLRPNLKHGEMSQEEEDLIIRLHNLLGNRWSLIAGRLPGRTDNEIKNYWNAHLIKRYPQFIKTRVSFKSSSNKRSKISHAPISVEDSNDKQEAITTDNSNNSSHGDPESQQLPAGNGNSGGGDTVYEDPSLPQHSDFRSINVWLESYENEADQILSWMESSFYFPEDSIYPAFAPYNA